MTKQTLFALSLGFAGLILATQAAQSQPRQCGARDAVLSTLAGTFGETRRGLGLAGNGAVVELFASAETGSWTVTVTLASGMTCLVASGEGWTAVDDRLPADGAPA